MFFVLPLSGLNQPTTLARTSRSGLSMSAHWAFLQSPRRNPPKTIHTLTQFSYQAPLYNLCHHQLIRKIRAHQPHLRSILAPPQQPVTKGPERHTPLNPGYSPGIPGVQPRDTRGTAPGYQGYSPGTPEVQPRDTRIKQPRRWRHKFFQTYPRSTPK